MNQLLSNPVVLARYALLALAILKGITFGIAIEQEVMDSWQMAAQTSLIVVAAVAAWRINTAPKLWIIVALFTYLTYITIFAFVEPKTLIQAFFLKAGVIGILVWALYRITSPKP